MCGVCLRQYVFSQGALILSGQQALSVLSNNGLCSMALLAIFTAVTFLIALPRTLNRLSWLGFFSVVFIAICGVLDMIGAGLNPVDDRILMAAVPTKFDQAFLAITGPVRSFLSRWRMTHAVRPSRFLRIAVGNPPCR